MTRHDTPRRPHGSLRATAFFVLVLAGWASAAPPTPPQHIVAALESTSERTAHDGVVEAVRQSVVSSQVSGAIVALAVKAGDRVQAGQTLARIDARASEQSTAAADAQVQVARAALEEATRDVERQRLLFQKRYISEAALDRAEAQFRTTQAQVSAQLSQAAASRTQTGFFSVRAPYAGVVAEVPVALGDMAMPGRPLVTLYDPVALRVAASVPVTALPTTLTESLTRVELPAGPDRKSLWLEPLRVAVLPTVDPGSHTAVVRLDLPPNAAAKPGAFARAWLPAGQSTASGRILVPTSAVVRRAEVTGVYTLDPNDRPLLRQVRLGRTVGDRVEILTGVSPGDRVVTDAGLAARIAAPN